MRIGFIGTRLSGTDGVSLEAAKWSQVLERMGHRTYYCAGELGEYASVGTLIPELHFTNQKVQQINQLFFQEKAGAQTDDLLDEIRRMANQLRNLLRNFILAERLDLIIVQNVFAIPMHLPLAVCLTDLINDLDLKTIAHHHDFFWERERFQTSVFPDFLDRYFPPNLPSVRHVTINSIARRTLKQRRGIDSIVVPNVLDFATEPPALDAHGRGIRDALNLPSGSPFILQPTRVIQRKGIELAIELVSRMKLENPRLFITHSASDEGLDYLHWLEYESKQMGVSLELIQDMISVQKKPHVSGKYSLADAYLAADLVTFPSIYEGFGNALLEAVYYKRPVVVNRYPVYNSDIRPKGFEFIELNGFVDDKAVNQALQIVHSPDSVREVVRNNFSIAREHYSLEALERNLMIILESF